MAVRVLQETAIRGRLSDHAWSKCELLSKGSRRRTHTGLRTRSSRTNGARHGCVRRCDSACATGEGRRGPRSGTEDAGTLRCGATPGQGARHCTAEGRSDAGTDRQGSGLTLRSGGAMYGGRGPGISPASAATWEARRRAWTPRRRGCEQEPPRTMPLSRSRSPRLRSRRPSTGPQRDARAYGRGRCGEVAGGARSQAISL